ncbi:MAG: putative mycofactocin radical SAM maturase MftC [Phycisphaerae bacterium]|nr:putative mycofactocin radical SAM maturase MftC [Phycisphaerae bacterium]
MIHVSKLYCEHQSPGDSIRYGQDSKSPIAARSQGQVPKTASQRRPIVVWNITRKCNLRCLHCYTDSEAKDYGGELTTDQCKVVLDDLAAFGVPAVLFSGGEPTTRPDLLELVAYARSKGLRPTLSTNGTLIHGDKAKAVAAAGFTYVGISLDGIGEVNDHFRGLPGAFDRAMTAFRSLRELGQRVGLRMTLTRHNFKHLEEIFDLLEAERIPRACFYHLAYSGRGQSLAGERMDLTHAETRRAMDLILRRTKDFHDRGVDIEILTVDNHVDGVYLYRKLQAEDPERAERVRELLEWNGGGRWSSGVGIGNIDFNGNVHADQFWMHYSFGNVKDRPFSEIWMDTSDPVMAGLKDKAAKLHGRCAADACRYWKMCGGSLRVRAERATAPADGGPGDPWSPDPACYLTDEEIGLTTDAASHAT